MARHQRSKEDNRAIREWLAAGNKVTKCEPNARTEFESTGFSWGKKKKKAVAVKPKDVDTDSK